MVFRRICAQALMINWQANAYDNISGLNIVVGPYTMFVNIKAIAQNCSIFGPDAWIIPYIESYSLTCVSCSTLGVLQLNGMETMPQRTILGILFGGELGGLIVVKSTRELTCTH